MAKEIERKWILNHFPENLPAPIREKKIETIYLSIDPEIRVSRHTYNEGSKDITICKVCHKIGEGLSRDEFECKVDKKFFEDIYQKYCALNLRPIIKHHFLYDYEGFPLEISIVDEGTPSEYVYSEVEFDSEEASREYKPPFEKLFAVSGDSKFFEVTDESWYLMKNYWKRTRWQHL